MKRGYLVITFLILISSILSGCIENKKEEINLEIMSNESDIRVDTPISFQIQNIPDSAKVNWYLENGSTFEGNRSISHIFSDVGNYTISANATWRNGKGFGTLFISVKSQDIILEDSGGSIRNLNPTSIVTQRMDTILNQELNKPIVQTYVVIQGFVGTGKIVVGTSNLDETMTWEYYRDLSILIPQEIIWDERYDEDSGIFNSLHDDEIIFYVIFEIENGQCERWEMEANIEY